MPEATMKINKKGCAASEAMSGQGHMACSEEFVKDILPASSKFGPS
jgi:hypothetical protein